STRRKDSLELGSAIFRAASEEFDIGFLLGLVLWHLVCQSSDCQDKLSRRNRENTGALTFWYLVCQKYSSISSAKKTSPKQGGDESCPHVKNQRRRLSWLRQILQSSGLPLRRASRTRPMKP